MGREGMGWQVPYVITGFVANLGGTGKGDLT
jgi:hypothetical protein